MNIVVYSTNSNTFEGEDFQIEIKPSRKEVWENAARLHPEHTFCIATQLPGMFLLDLDGNKIKDKASNIRYVILKENDEVKLAQEISELSPDIAIAATFWVRPYDWLGIKDSLVAEALQNLGIKAIAHSADTQLICFDKWKTHQTLSLLGFNIAQAQYVHHELYWSERGNKDLKNNIYKEYILNRIASMKYPVVVKPTYSLSSYSMVTAVSFKQALVCLNSGKTKTDCLVEEYLEGDQFGTEIYGCRGNYKVMPPFIFSVDKWGLTSPKQSIKMGPVTSSKYKIAELQSELTRLAESLNLNGIAQVDLIFCKGKWHIIEINPRMSGMTETFASALGISSAELLLKSSLGTQNITGFDKNFDLPQNPQTENRVICNFKIPLQEDSAQLAQIASRPEIVYTHQLHNIAAKQLRERGYTEIIIKAKNSTEIIQKIETLEKDFPGTVDSTFLENAKIMASKISDQ